MALRHATCWFLYGMTTLGAEVPEGHRAPQAGTQSTQWFSRGLELEFGNDFALEVDGIPLNVPSHVRGPGFLDMGIVIPELAEACRYTRGSYQAVQGPFAVAGSAALDVPEAPERVMALAYGGARTDNFGRFLLVDHLPGTRTTYALDVTRNERPWNDLMGSARLNAAFRRQGEGPRGRWTFTVLGSEDTSDGGAAMPLRPAPDAGAEDPRAGDGTWNQRLLMGWRLVREDGPWRTTRAGFYAGGHHVRIWNNWTGFLKDPVHGDQLEQVDRRFFVGGNTTHSWVVRSGALEWTHTLGFQARFDRVSAAEAVPTLDRGRLADSPVPALAGRADLLHGALLGQSSLAFAPGWEASVGLRLDGQSNRATRLLGLWTPQRRSILLGSPRAGISYTPVEGTVFALQAGQGLRAGDVFRENQPLVRTRSAEFTAQTRPARPWVASVTLWRLDLEAETLFDPLADAFTPRGPARHLGIETYHQLKGGAWHGEVAWGWSRAEFKNEPAARDRVPGSAPQAGYAGVGWKDDGLGVDLKLRRVGPRPLTPDGAFTAAPQTSLELRIQKDFGSWSAALEILNAFSRKTCNAEYHYPSRLAGEPAPVVDYHVKPADPQAIRVEVRRRF